VIRKDSSEGNGKGSKSAKNDINSCKGDENRPHHVDGDQSWVSTVNGNRKRGGGHGGKMDNSLFDYLTKIRDESQRRRGLGEGMWLIPKVSAVRNGHRH